MVWELSLPPFQGFSMVHNFSTNSAPSLLGVMSRTQFLYGLIVEHFIQHQHSTTEET